MLGWSSRPARLRGVDSLYPYAATLHSWLRVLVLLLCAFVFLRSLSAWMGSKPFTTGDRSATRWLTIAIDVQFLVGLLLYVGISPLTRQAFSNFGAAMKDDERRRFAVEHPTMMLAAIALWHAASIIGRRSPLDSVRHRWHAIASGLALLLLYVGTPWPWSAIARPLLRFGG